MHHSLALAWQLDNAIMMHSMAPDLLCIDAHKPQNNASSISSDLVAVCSVALEQGFSEATIKALEKKGHKVIGNVSEHARGMFGRGQIIFRDAKTGVLWGGSEPRGDGQVLAW